MGDVWAVFSELDGVTQERKIGEDLAESLSREARRRVEAGTFFRHIAYASLVAMKPA
jgi:hypothetical protein